MTAGETDGRIADEKSRLAFSRQMLVPLRDMATEAGDGFMVHGLNVLIQHIAERLGGDGKDSSFGG